MDLLKLEKLEKRLGLKNMESRFFEIYWNGDHFLDIDLGKLKTFVEENSNAYSRLIKTYDRELYDYISSLVENTKSFGENMWLFLNNYETKKKCHCSGSVAFNNLTDGYGKYCSRCYAIFRKNKEYFIG